MSSANPAGAPNTALPHIEDLNVAIVVAEWNSHITSRLLDGALYVFKNEGYEPDTIDVYNVPGTVELTFAASRLIETEQYDAVIVIGCVIRGGTPHFEYVCQSVTEGIAKLNADSDIPVIFGVLTVNTEQEALDRVGGKMGHKGVEAAVAAIKMVDFNRTVEGMIDDDDEDDDDEVDSVDYGAYDEEDR